MKAIIVVGAFLAAVLIAMPLLVLAKQGDPIPGVPIGLEGDPGSVVISQTKTNGAGVAVFRNVKPGKYRLTIGTINWGDGSTARKPVSKISENESPLPTAIIGINIPGQAKVVRTISKAGAHSRITAIAVDPRDVSENRLLIPFTVAGNKVQTVTVTIFDRWPD
ncbi:MAG TPA: carboxypeptidase-like regulatory domain-containing protein [Candidatus Rubrimentiphilum sp.]|nr:carboxypeptidase-like regulatory domain-containing protein [Candidatus Rubrimentiphilum sp.]